MPVTPIESEDKRLKVTHIFKSIYGYGETGNIVRLYDTIYGVLSSGVCFAAVNGQHVWHSEGLKARFNLHWDKIVLCGIEKVLNIALAGCTQQLSGYQVPVRRRQIS